MTESSANKRTTGDIRRDLYDYLKMENFDVTEDRHKVIRRFVVEHGMVENEDIRRKYQSVHDAIVNMPLNQSKETIENWLNHFRCPICGMEMKALDDLSRVTVCGHLSKMSFSYA